MQTKNDVPCGDKPRPATSLIELLDAQMGKLRQELTELVMHLGEHGLSSGSVTEFLAGIRRAMGGAAKATVKHTLESLDEATPSIEMEGQRLRYRGRAKKLWLSMHGAIEVERRVYRCDGPGVSRCVPLDVAIGMVDRYMLPDVEDPVAMAMSMLPQRETEELLAKLLPEGPSATAMRNAIDTIGRELDQHRVHVEHEVNDKAPLSESGDILTVSFDGAMIAMREEDGLAWREASVGTISVYGPGEESPVQHDVRYLARMPESKMEALFEQAARRVAAIRADRTFRELVVICDGSATLWDQIEGRTEFRGATLILDFFHASENVMKVANAIFGDDDERARRWHKKLRFKLQVDHDGAARAIHSMRRYRARLSRGGARWKIVTSAMGFANHRDRMCYSDYMQRGLPVGSGPVEAAAKTIIQARMKRSGMRWSHRGGQHILDLRAHLKSGCWDTMWSALKTAAVAA